MPTFPIKVTYRAIDGARISRTYKTLEWAQQFAQKWVGRFPDTSGSYAVSDDGVGKITAQGATMAELFPPVPRPPAPTDAQLYAEEEEAMAAAIQEATDEEAEWFAQGVPKEPFREPGCTCSAMQLEMVGCECFPARAADARWPEVAFAEAPTELADQEAAEDRALTRMEERRSERTAEQQRAFDLMTAEQKANEWKDYDDPFGYERNRGRF